MAFKLPNNCFFNWLYQWESNIEHMKSLCKYIKMIYTNVKKIHSESGWNLLESSRDRIFLSNNRDTLAGGTDIYIYTHTLVYMHTDLKYLPSLFIFTSQINMKYISNYFTCPVLEKFDISLQLIQKNIHHFSISSELFFSWL